MTPAEKKKAYDQWRLANKDKRKATQQAYAEKNWAVMRSRKVVSNKLRHRNAFPVWATHDMFIEVYEESRRLTKETGVLHVVDHIIPLHGATVTGLHVPSNLQILTDEENKRKGTVCPAT